MQNTSVLDRERRLLERAISLARALGEERERVARRLAELEKELSVLAAKLDGPPTVITLAHPEQHRS